MDKEENKLGKKLEELRGKLSYRDIAELTGNELSHNQIRLMEQGVDPRTKKPINITPSSLRTLAKVYNYSYYKLLYLAGIIDFDIEEFWEFTQKVINDELLIEGIPATKEQKEQLMEVYGELLGKIN